TERARAPVRPGGDTVVAPATAQPSGVPVAPGSAAVEAPVEGGVSSRAPVISADGAAEPSQWRDATPEDNTLIDRLVRLPSSGPIRGAESRSIVEQLGEAATRPGGLNAFLVLYETALTRGQSADAPRGPALESLVARLTPPSVRARAEELFATVQPRQPP